MPDLLLELRSEEIPARMQRRAAGDLRKAVTDGLVEAGLTYEGAREYWTPRRLTLDIRGVEARSKDVREEKKGPRTDAPAKAIEGFLRGAGLGSIEQAETRADPKKGEFYVAVVERPGQPAEEIVAALMPGIIRDFPWPKSMRWGRASREPGSLRWVRPLQSILCTFGPETAEPVVVDFEVGGIRSGNLTYGHRFHAPDPIAVRRFDDYAASLEKAFVVLDAERRKDIIRTDADNLAFARGLEVVPDEALLEEVAGLVEWPVALMGSFEPEFLQIPPEVVRLTIKANQKCFVTRIPGRAELSSNFILVSNIEASDGGAEIARGNGKVVRARLSDALYFWQTDQADLPDLDVLRPSAEKFGLDLAKPLDQRMAKLDALGVTFHAKLGTQGERVARIARLAEEIARTAYPDGATLEGQPVSADELAALARRAAVLAKADLPSEAVGEFPELQGLMGRYYAGLQGEHPSVQAAIEEHYKPQGPSDAVPNDPVAVSVALADKLDTLVGFWAIDEKPTGSKDPYALRRAALGVIRVVLENGVRITLTHLTIPTLFNVFMSKQVQASSVPIDNVKQLMDMGLATEELAQQVYDRLLGSSGRDAFLEVVPDLAWSISRNLLSFFHDRLKVQLREQGARHDLVDAVLSGGQSGAPTSPSSGGRGEAAGGGDAAAGGSSAAPATPPRDPADRDPPHRGEGGASGSGSAANDDLLDIARRWEALGAFLDSEDGQNLLAGTRRAANILAAEEKKGTRVADEVNLALLAEPEEKALAGAIGRAEVELEAALATENYAQAMTALAKLRIPVDAFFDKVLVNAEDEDLRANRLALLARIRAATRQVADFSKIGG